jgi:hypothetical protein
MSDQERPLPKPPGTAFGRKRSQEEGDEGTPLMADRLARALAEGKVEEFMEREIPDNEHARALLSMMMGMTGMMPEEGLAGKRDEGVNIPDMPGIKESQDETVQPSPASADLLNAVTAGDVKGLMGILKKELNERSSDGPPSINTEHKAESDTPPVIDKEIIDQLISIASDNSLTMDWIILRAIRLYVEEYKKTGRL